MYDLSNTEKEPDEMLMIRLLNHAFRFRLRSDLDSLFQIKVLWARIIEECKCVLVVIAELGNVCEQEMVKLEMHQHVVISLS